MAAISVPFGLRTAATRYDTSRADPRTTAVRQALAGGETRAAIWVYLDSSRLAGPDAARHENALGEAPAEPTFAERARDVAAQAGAQVRHVSLWLEAVSVMADSAVAERLARRPDVLRITRVGRLIVASGRPLPSDSSLGGSVPGPSEADTVSLTVSAEPPDEADSPVPTATPLQTDYGPNGPALVDLGIPRAHQFGFTGEGVRVAILDTGFEPAHESLQTRRLVGTRDFINGDEDVSDGAGEPDGPEHHGTRVWSLVGGFKPGSLIGPAYDASFLLAKVDAEPGDTEADEDRWVAGVEWADSMGARVIVSAVVFRYDFTDQPETPYEDLNGDVTVVSRVADEAARRGIVVVTAIGEGDGGAGTLSAPADADSVVAVGAVDADGMTVVFADGQSGRGPTVDGRTKPEVVARGSDLVGASSATQGGYDSGLAGTSYSSALIGGAAAMVIEAWPSLGPFAIRQALMSAGSNAANRDNAIGWGVPDVAAAILFPAGLTPSSISTVDLNRRLTTVAPRFTWTAPLVHPSMGPVTYRLEVARDAAFTEILYTDTVRDAFSIDARRAIQPTATLFWRVTATAQLGVSTKSAGAGPFAMPDWVRLDSPPGDEVTFVESVRPDLRWVPLAAPAPIGPLVYDVEILAHSTGTPVQPAVRNLTSSTLRVPQPLVPNNSYRWRVIARTQLGAVDTVESAEPFVVTSSANPPATLLHSNFPNPFPQPGVSENTRVWFDLAAQSAVRLTVLDQRGRLIRRLIPADPGCGTVELEPGLYGRTDSENPCVQVVWDGRDAEGRFVAAGLYIMRLDADGQTLYRRMLYLGGR